jgi:hypothetical protein
MSRCKGLHCPSCKHGGGSGAGFGALLFLALILIAVALARPIKHATDSALRMVVEVAEIAALVAISTVGLAVICGLVLAGIRIWHWMLTRPSYTALIERQSVQDSRQEVPLSNLYAIRPTTTPIAPAWSVAPDEVIARSDQRRQS